MMIKVKHILLIIIVLLAVVVSVYIFKKREQVTNNIVMQNEEEVEQVKSFNYFEMGYIMSIKDGDWNGYPLTEDFKSKYNEKDGILGDVQYDKIEYRPFADTDSEYAFKNDYTYFVITQGKRKTVYDYNVKCIDEKIDDIKLFPFEIVNSEGVTLEYEFIGSPIDEGTWTACFSALAQGGDREKDVAVTKHFHQKYPYFLDLFIHYSPLGVNSITFIKEKSSWEKKEAYFEVDSTLECINRHYLVKFTLDDKGYLDDADVKLVGEYPYERDHEMKGSAEVMYKHSNLNRLKWTEKFKKQYNPEFGTLPEIDKININEEGHADIIDNNTWIKQNVYKDGTWKWYCIKEIVDENGYLDDIKYELIDYKGEIASEAKEAYLRDHPQE